MKVKTSYVPREVDWLTVDREYDVLFERGEVFTLNDDDGERIYCNFKRCPHLNGYDWEIIND